MPLFIIMIWLHARIYISLLLYSKYMYMYVCMMCVLADEDETKKCIRNDAFFWKSEMKKCRADYNNLCQFFLTRFEWNLSDEKKKSHVCDTFQRSISFFFYFAHNNYEKIVNLFPKQMHYLIMFTNIMNLALFGG